MVEPAEGEAVSVRGQQAQRAIVCLAAIHSVGYLAYVAWVLPTTTRSDYLYHLHLLARWWEGGHTTTIVGWVFEVQSGHPIVPSKVLALLNFLLFDYSLEVSSVLAILVLIAYVGVVLFCTWRLLPPGWARSVSMLILALLLLNPTYYEVLVYSEAIPPLFLSTTFAYGSTYLLYRLSETGRDGQTPQLVAATVLGVLCSVTNGAGLAILPAWVVLGGFLWLSRDRPLDSYARRRFALAFVVLVALVVAFRVLPSRFGDVQRPPFELWRTVRAFFALTISPLFQTKSSRATWNGLGFCVLLLLTAAACFRTDRKRFPLLAAWVTLGLVGAAGIAANRAGREAVVPSRYTVYTLPIFLGFVPAFALASERLRGTQRRVLIASAAVLLALSAPSIRFSLVKNQETYSAVARETAIVTRGVALQRVERVFRLNGGLGASGWLSETFPRLKRMGLARTLLRDYRPGGDAFLEELRLSREVVTSSLPGDSASVGYVGFLARFPKQDWMGDYPNRDDAFQFADDPDGWVEGELTDLTFRGVALGEPEWVFAVDATGKVLGVSKPAPSPYVRGEEAGGDPKHEGYFDFTCVLVEGSFTPPCSVIAWRDAAHWARLPARGSE